MRLRLNDALAVALALTAFTAVATQAQDPGRAQRFEQRDLNRDGVLSRDEYVSTGGHPGNFRALDHNNDGVLSREEFGAGPASGAPAPPAPVSDAFRDLDRNGDGVLSRGEWDDPAFNRVDRNNDGQLTRDEYTSPLDANTTEGRFGDLDRDNNGWLTRSEFGQNRVAFDLADRNNDGRVGYDEYANPRSDESAGARFDEYDLNRDGVVTRSEWRGDAETFGVLDTSRNGRLESREMNDLSALRDRFRLLDDDRDGWISRQEWRGSQSSFDFFDRDGDRRLSDREYVGYY